MPPTLRKRLFLQDAQELGLQIERHLADFVEEDRARAGHFEQPRLVPVGAGERAFHVPEELAFQQVGRQGRTVDGDERLARMPQVMDGPRGDLFAGAGVADDENRIALAGGDELDHLQGVDAIAGLRPARATAAAVSSRK